MKAVRPARTLSFGSDFSRVLNSFGQISKKCLTSGNSSAQSDVASRALESSLQMRFSNILFSYVQSVALGKEILVRECRYSKIEFSVELIERSIILQLAE